MLVVYCSSWFSIFLGSCYRIATPISGHVDEYLGYDTSFHIFPKGLSYWLFEVKRHGNQATSGFGDCSFFEVDMGSRSDLGGNSPLILNAGKGRA